MEKTWKNTRLNRKEKDRIDRILSYILLITLSVFFIAPLLWMILTAFKTDDEIIRGLFFPTELRFDNFIEAINGIPFMQHIVNTLYYATFATIGIVLSTTVTAYAFAKLHWPFKNQLFIVMISTLVIPSIVIQIPLYSLYRNLGWLNTYNPLIIPAFFAVGAVNNIFLLRQTFMGIPDSLIESAKMDGASEFTVFRTIMLPLAKSIIIVIAIMSFMNFWNDFYNPLIYIDLSIYNPISLAIKSFSTQYNNKYNLTMAASIIITIPTLILFIIAQRQIVDSVAHTGVKG